MNKKVMFSSARNGEKQQDRWQTPSAVFEQLNEEFGFTLDAAAEPETALCEQFFTAEDDALKQDWQGQTVYCNPPYSKLRDFATKAKEEALKGATVVMLIPARTDTQAFHESLSDGEVRFIKGRLKFQQNGQEQDAAPFPSMVCVMGPNVEQNMKKVTRDNLKG
ncbi:phage N-6-adenine-methyltransferase [Vibrio algarum]|uniref:Phage N-6-adenine-methyltransferase n=1 Tax=Vibrio algarum TaxID=3020714 RepID=A0ABT4YL31_9VIBR|nr:phage N-6-adenine-methyltransferase [Vibrio sp. KJ40-1]MDB1122243.1 phage N-6-adenine-methyltransferase [Vibrio sp. KJ40-1]